jgi:hypothetical protein
MPWIDAPDGERVPISLPEHLPMLRQAVVQQQAALVVIDPLMAFIGGGVDTFRDHDVRRALAPLVQLAEETGPAVLVIRHLNKGNGPALYRGGGSIAIIGAARLGLLVARDLDDETRRVLAVTKSNLAAAAPGLSFSVEGAENGAARIAWHGESPHRADQLLAVPVDGQERTALTDAVAFVREYLSEGAKTSKELESEARAAGISSRTLERARHQAGVRARKIGFGAAGSWVLELAPERVSGRDDAYEGVA